MSHATPWICKFCLVLITLNVSACALFEERKGPAMYYGPREQVFLASFEEVWRSVNLVLQPYPLRVSNMDQGILETDEIRGFRVWGPPYKSDTAASGETYRMTVRVVKGDLSKRAATKVTVVKDTQLRRDFFSDPKSMPSDGMEEKALLYRVGREIQVERALAKAQKKQNQAQ